MPEAESAIERVVSISCATIASSSRRISWNAVGVSCVATRGRKGSASAQPIPTPRYGNAEARMIPPKSAIPCIA